MRVTPVDELQGHVALGLALRHLANTGIVMEATAHPDDEDNGLLVMLNRGQGFRTALATATRGNGGQNEIGPEIFEALGVLRTQELAALHRFDGAEQYFTRAVDFGYSFSIDETFEKWGRDEITEDYVRLIRTIRPDVIFAMSPTGNNGGQHHNASAVLSHEAYKLAGDAAKYPDQLKAGLRPWQPRKFYYSAGFGPDADAAPARLTRINSSVYDPLLGKTYSDIGTEARSMHKCQGMAQLLALPGPVDEKLSADRIHDCRAAAARRPFADRRHRHLDRVARAVCRRPSAEGPHRRPRRDLGRGSGGAEEVRQRERRCIGGAARRRAPRGPRAARSAPRHVDRRRREIRDRVQAAPEGARVPAGADRGQRHPRRGAGRATESSCRGRT